MVQPRKPAAPSSRQTPEGYAAYLNSIAAQNQVLAASIAERTARVEAARTARSQTAPDDSEVLAAHADAAVDATMDADEAADGDVDKEATVPEEFRKSVSQIAGTLKESRDRVKGLTKVKVRADYLKYVDRDASGTTRYDIRVARKLMDRLDQQRDCN